MSNEYKVIRVRHHGQLLVRETEHEAVNCLHCGEPRDRVVKIGRRKVRHARAFFSYDDSGMAFCNRNHFAAFWDDVLRRNGTQFQRFILELVTSPEFPAAVLSDKVFLDGLMKQAKKLAAQVGKPASAAMASTAA